jgi:hypothetical protein
MRVFYLLLFVMFFSITAAQARPVSYPGGWTFMTYNDGDKNSGFVHYSPTAKMALGYKFEYWRDKEMTLNALQMNNLLKRWNNKDSQANFYLKSGLGVADQNDDQALAAHTGIALDWENRRFFTSYENRFTQAGDIDDFYMQSARVGVAPYEGEYGDLHTWLMLQVDHKPEANDKFTFTPMVRLFKDVHLVEFGVSDEKEILFNYIYRY